MRNFFRQFEYLEPVIELLRLGCFLTLLTLLTAHLVAVLRQAEQSQKRRATITIVFVLAVTFAAGFTQLDAWPFTHWALVHGLRSSTMHSWEIEGIDASGGVWRVDKGIFQPMAPEEIAASLARVPHMSPSARDEVLRWIYERAESGRARVVSGKTFPRNDWLLGRWSAPYHFTAELLWRERRDVPADPFRRIRLIFTAWSIEERFRRGDAAVHRTVVGEYAPDA